MKRILWIATAFAIILCAVPTEARIVKIATYNVENMFDEHDDPYVQDYDRYAGGALLVKPKEELEALAKVIRELDADVIGLQEVENRGFLEEFNREYIPDMGYTHVELVWGNDPRGIDVAVLSRFPLGPVVSYRHLDLSIPGQTEPSRFSRDLLEVSIRPPDAMPFRVYVAHLKSRGGGEPANWQRHAEARKIREIWDYRLKAEPDSLFVFLADVNDDPPAETVKILTGSGRTAVEFLPAEAPDGSTWTQYSRYTTRYPPIQFDYIFASPAMKKRVLEYGIFRSPDGTPEFETQRLASDHKPVWATFDLSK